MLILERITNVQDAIENGSKERSFLEKNNKYVKIETLLISVKVDT